MDKITFDPATQELTIRLLPKGSHTIDFVIGALLRGEETEVAQLGRVGVTEIKAVNKNGGAPVWHYTFKDGLPAEVKD